MATVSGTPDIGALFRLHGPMVYRRALRLLGRKEDAEEATQEVFIRVMRSMHEFQGRSSVTTWLYQVTTNYCLNQLRDHSRRRQLLAENVLREENSSASESDLLHLRRLLSEADEQQARAAVYVYLDGMSHEEAAELLGVSKRTVGNFVERFLTWARQRGAESDRPKKESA
ncbi:MAG: RNA polymerase sigma factor [Myxococcales bacterium]|nr:RNA polymerase sigma factor [Myxococcales bacterium]